MDELGKINTRPQGRIGNHLYIRPYGPVGNDQYLALGSNWELFIYPTLWTSWELSIPDLRVELGMIIYPTLRMVELGTINTRP